jgi:endoglucanase
MGQRSVLTSLLALLSAMVCAQKTVGTPATRPDPFVIDVSGNRFVDGLGHTITLHGVGYRVMTPACDGNVPMTAAPLTKWHINAVRMQLSETCWLGINGQTSQKASVIRAVQDLEANGIYTILELAYTGPGSCVGQSGNPLPNAHSIDFWTDVSKTFASDHALIFNLFNEPQGTLTWDCWLNGGCTVASRPSCATGNFKSVGMQALINAIRKNAMFQPILVDCLNYSSDCSQFITNMPSDPSGKIVGDIHLYNTGWTVRDFANKVNYFVRDGTPVLIGELGEYDCAHGFIDSIMAVADAYNPPIGYFGFSWYVRDCAKFPSLITDYNGTPTLYGLGFKNHLVAIR